MFKYHKRGKRKQAEENKGNKQKTNNKIVYLNVNISVVTLNISHLDTPMKDRDCQSIKANKTLI